MWTLYSIKKIRQVDIDNKPIERKYNLKVIRKMAWKEEKNTNNQVEDKIVRLDLNPTISQTTLNKNTLIKSQTG